jgi:hypothetical protein
MVDAPESRRHQGYFGRQEDPYSTGEHIAHLRSLLNERAVSVGVRESPGLLRALDAIVAAVRTEPVPAELLVPLLNALATKPDLVASLAHVDSFAHLTDLVVAHRRRLGLAELQRQAAGPTGTAESMLEIVRSELWVFGGRPVGGLAGLLPTRCVPLLRADATLELVCVESPQVPDLVVTGPALGARVRQAAECAATMVTELEQETDELALRLDVLPRTVHATVLIGHPDHVRADRAEIREQLRLFNAKADRVTLVTYDDVIHIGQSTIDELR